MHEASGEKGKGCAFLLAVVAFLLVAAFAGCARGIAEYPSASVGILDLRSWNFERDGAVRLAGEWDFFPGLLLRGSEAVDAFRVRVRSVPDVWKGSEAGLARGRGSGTYRLKVLLPNDTPPLDIMYSTVSTAFELDANGMLIASAGRPSLDPSRAEAAYRPGVARLPLVGEDLVLVLRDSNYEYRVGGMWRPLYLGPEGPLERKAWSRDVGSISLAASLALLALVFAFFLRGGQEGKAFLFFCLFAAATALRSLVTGAYALTRIFPSIEFDLLIRLEYLSVFSLLPCGLLFFTSLYPEEFDRRLGAALLLISAAFGLLLPFAPLRFLTWSIQPYYALVALYIAAIAATLARAVSRRRQGALPMAIGASILLIAAINDMLFSSFLIDTANIFPVSILAFVFVQAFVLAGRHRSTQMSLRRALAEKDLLIKEVHHRVKNSLQIVSSIATLQAHRFADPAAIAACAAMQARIKAVGLVHEKLYGLESTEFVDAGAYARELSGLLAEGYGGEGEGALLVQADAVRVPADLCIDIGLVLTELVANAYKYASAGGRRGRISVFLKREPSGLRLEVEDEGPGFPTGAEPKDFTTLGFRLVSSVAKKREARIEIKKRIGAVVEVHFPMGAEPAARTSPA
jgi:two-component sensor histidine kinase